jgi:hypothetical protein
MLVVLNTVWNGMWLYTDDRLNSRTVQWIYHCIKFAGQLFVCLMFVNHLRYRHCCKKLFILWISIIIACEDNIIFFWCLGNVFVRNTKRFLLIVNWIFINISRIFHVFWNKEITTNSPTEILRNHHPFSDFRHNFIMLGQSYLYTILMRRW